MTNITKYFLVELFCLLFCVKYGTSILCYDCNSLYDPRCGEEFDSFSLGVVNCSLRDPLEHIPEVEPTLCRSIKIDISGKVRVVRQCGYIRNEAADDQACQRKTSYQELHVTYCSCTTDLCNSGRGIAPKGFILEASILFLIFCYLQM